MVETVPPVSAMRRQRLVIVLLVIIFLAPALGSWIIFNFTTIGRQEPGASHGILVIPPRPLPDLSLFDQNNPSVPQRLYGKWNIVFLIGVDCDQLCEEKLYAMRQIRLAMGNESQRLQRVLVVFDGVAPGLSPAQTQAYPGQLLVHATAAVKQVFALAATESPLGLRRIYLIDPRGYLMMSYPEGTNPSGIIKDLERLLRYSSIG